MPSSSTPYLIRRGETFYFRKAVPRRLIGSLGRAEFRYSLKTRNLRTAKIRCRYLSNLFDDLLDGADSVAHLNQESLDRALKDFFAGEWWKMREAVHLEPWGGAGIHAQVEAGDEATSMMEGWIASASYPDWVQSIAKRIWRSGGGEENDIPKGTLLNLSEAVCRAFRDLERMRESIAEGLPEKAFPADPLFREVPEPLAPPKASEPQGNTSLGGLVEKYIAFKSGGSWTPKSEWEARRVLRWMVGFVGPHAQIGQVTKDRVREFRDLLDALPANASQMAGSKSLALEELVKGAEGPQLGHATRTKYLGAVKGFLKWCQAEGYIDIDPSQGIKVQGKANDPKDARHPFAKAQLEALFHSPQYTGHFSASRRSKPGHMIIKDGKYWIPLLGLMTGMRLGEIVQLRVGDVKEDDGIRYFDVNKDDGKQLKTASSARVIPVPPLLCKLGFLKFVAQRGEDGLEARLFPEVKSGKNGAPSHNFSKYFTRYMTQIGAKTDKTTFHSFRHNFEDMLFAAGVEEARRKLLLGHRDKSVTASYGSNPKAKLFAADMAKIDPGVDLSHLVPNEKTGP